MNPIFFLMLLKHGVFKYIFFLKIIMKPLKKQTKKKNKDTFHKQLSSCLFKLSGQKQKKGEG